MFRNFLVFDFPGSAFMAGCDKDSMFFFKAICMMAEKRWPSGELNPSLFLSSGLCLTAEPWTDGPTMDEELSHKIITPRFAC